MGDITALRAAAQGRRNAAGAVLNAHHARAWENSRRSPLIFAHHLLRGDAFVRTPSCTLALSEGEEQSIGVSRRRGWLGE